MNTIFLVHTLEFKEIKFSCSPKFVYAPPPPPQSRYPGAGLIAPAGNSAPFEKTLQRWRFGNIVSDLTGPRFKLQTSPSRDERVTAPGL